MDRTTETLRQHNAHTIDVTNAGLDFLFSQIDSSTTSVTDTKPEIVLVSPSTARLERTKSTPAELEAFTKDTADTVDQIPASAFVPVETETTPATLSQPSTTWESVGQAGRSVLQFTERVSRQFASSSSASSIAQQILRPRPANAHALCLFVSSTDSPDGDWVAAAICIEIAKQTEERILLIDANTQKQFLSERLTGARPGFVQMATGGSFDQNLVLKTDLDNLDFLSFGIGDLSFRRLVGHRVLQLTGQLRNQYGFTCIATGTCSSISARQLSRYCDACYVIIDAIDRKDAVLSSVQYLKRHGARVEGCIATDHEPTATSD